MKKSGLLVLLILCVISWTSFGQDPDNRFKMVGKNPQSILINQSYSETVEIFPFGQNDKPIYGLDVSADIKLNGENSIVRLVLFDTNFNEYLIYESYDLLLEGNNSFSIKEICEETSVLEGINPYSIQIGIENAQIQLKSLNFSTDIDSGLEIENLKKEKKQDQNAVKIQKINNNLKKKGKHWIAGPTSVSELSYGERKRLYGQSTFPSGFEYYSGGVILASSTASAETGDGILKSATTTAESPYVDEWDWRDRHGKNWITPITNQEGCGSCWAFATAGATEAMTNLFFNQQLNLDLSEQELVSCSGAGDCVSGYPAYALDYIKNNGIIDESTFPYSASDQLCSDKGNNPVETIKIGGRIDFGTSEYPKTSDVLKDMLIKLGPLSSGQRNWAHAMVLVGYKVVKEGDIFYYQNTDGVRSWQVVEAGSSLIGKTVWIFKNSWGPYFGDSGYVYIESTMNNFDWTHAIVAPITSTTKNYNVIFEDKDGDGYYWWGLGPKPATCPGHAEPDGNDSDATLGPLDDYGHCIVIGAQPMANFSANSNTVVEGEYVQFADISENALTREWMFEGGTPSTSTSSNPSVLYKIPGTYDVSLTVYNKDKSANKTITGYIVVETYMPDYCKSHGDATAQWIESVQVGTQTYISGSSASTGYQDLTDQSFLVDPGSNVTFNLKPGFTGRSYLEAWKIWIDYNGDLDFDDSGELVYSSSITSYPVSKDIAIPSNINIKTRMRVSMKRNESATACEIFSEGEVEDYIIQIGSSTSTVTIPVANFSANNTSINTNETVSFTDLTTNSPTSWSWTFAGGSPTTSTAQNPTVTYSTAGTYKVTLTATNADGSNTKSVDNYITVIEPVIAPVANFSASPRSLEKGETVSFSDFSTNTPTSWSWTFEGGNPATSTSKNPTVTYNTSGTYKVSLTATNAGGSNTKTAYNYIEVTEPVVLPVADFAANKTIINTGESVSFSDLSSDATARSWTFEGGSPTTSTAQNPVVTYYTAGTYKVTITATNADGTDTRIVDNYITVTDPVTVIVPVANFSANKTTINTGASVNFSDLSSNATSWSWTFEGADQTSSTLQNPSITYSKSGAYNVSLTATNSDGSDTKTIVDYIQVNEPAVLPVADFTANKTIINTGESVNFSDLSSNATSWSWTFEGADQTSSTLQNPSITYSKAGTYNVSLTATNSDGSDTKTIVDYIQVNEPAVLPVADFTANKTIINTGELVNFSDLSSDATSWSWTFEGADKTSSTLQNPSITYSTAGLFNVSLTVSNADGSDTKTIVDYIEVKKPVIAPVAEFSANTTTIIEGETIAFTDLSSNEPSSWSWTFQGGTPSTSTQQNPAVTYPAAGTYSVTLVSSNAGGSDTKVATGYIRVEEYVPSYCIPTATASMEWIAGVKINGQSKSSGSNGYNDFTAFGFDLESGTSQTITLTPGFSSRSKFEYWAVWIDFDQDMIFSDSEKILSSSKSKSIITASINIPVGLNITTRMRVAMSPTTPTACADLTGEIEDYTVKIYEPAPVADFTASSTNVTVGESVQFINTSMYNPTSLVWNFDSNYASASASASTSENPVVSYDSPGDYVVTLTASNNLGSSQKSMTITVYDQNDNSSVNYCAPSNISSTQNYITSVIFDGIEVQSGSDGYILAASSFNDIVSGQNYFVELSPLTSSTRNFWRVWIDFNQDGDFDDADETVFQLNNKKGTVGDNIFIPSYANGTTRMRIAMKIGSAPSSCEDGFDGEVEDYMISFTPPMASASNPASDSWVERNITVYPNPAINFININLDEVGFDDSYSVYDLSGKKLVEEQLTSSFLRVDLSGYPSGIYMVKVINFNVPTITKIIKK